MPAGRLHERYSFQKRETVDDGYGNKVGTWVEQFSARGSRQFFKGSEKFRDGGSVGMQRAILKIRRFPGSRNVTAAWRVVDARTQETYNVRAPEPMTDRRFIEFIVESGVNDG